jgi:hypothetical protein
MKKIYQFIGVTVSVLSFSNSLQSQVTTQTLNFTGSAQTVTVPSCVTSVTFQVRGAQGGTYSPGGTAGLGGLVTGVMTVTPGQVLTIYVGGQNGYNGGGIGGSNGNSVGGGPSLGFAGNGGGASDIRVGGVALTDRIVVAGGGGGAAANGVWPGCQVAGPAGNGGDGGGAIGATGTFGVGNPCNCGGGGGSGGFGGTAIAGGATGSYTNNTACLRSNWAAGQPGVLGIGGTGSTIFFNGTGGGGGGGGGYYGGGSGANGSDTTPGGGGGGGSSYTGAGTTSTTSIQGAQTGNGVVVLAYASGGVPISVVPTSTSICSGGTAVLTASGATTYTWSNGSPLSSITVTPIVTTNYTVTGTSACGTSSAVTTVSVNASPSVTVNSGSICAGNSFTITPSGASTYTITGGSSIVTPTVTSSYNVVGTGTNGCVSAAAVSNVTVNPKPIISVNSGVICSGNSFTMVPSGASTYTYSNGSAVVTPTASASYTITGTSSLGCVSASAAVSNVTVNANPTVTAVSSTSLICAGQSATLTASGAATYSWNTSSTLTAIAISPTVTTTYTVTGTNASNCKNVTTVTQNVSPCTNIESNATLLSGVSIYPNPNNGVFTVELINGLSKTIQVTDIAGRIILETSTTNDSVAINLAKFANGIYYVKVASNNASNVLKVVKQ